MANVIAEEKSTLLLVTRPNFKTLLEDDPAIAAKFLLATSRILAHRIRNAHNQLNKIV
jgi:CRP-like cAMP-binding protein